jgi:RHS repeat-associated protein
MTNIDNLAYAYNNGTNRINTISDATANAAGFNVNGATTGYGYDLSGNYLSDPYKKITTAKYYFNNLPKDITVSGGATNGSLRFTYDASGIKLRKEVFNTSNVSQLKQDYVGKIEYVNGVVEAIYTSEGRAVWVPATSTWRYEYNVTDHLGNVRAVISDLNNNNVLDIASNEIINQNDYYPFGLTMSKTGLANNSSTPDTKYQYNGKEYNSDLGLNLLDYHARWYDPTVARFTTVDPLAESTINLSTYNYCLNNPVIFIDPDGMKAVYNWSTGGYYDDQTGESRTWDDVQKEYSIGKYSSTKNALILSNNISENDEAMSNLLHSAQTSEGAVVPILASNTKDAANKLGNLFEKEQISNLYIGSHGGYSNQTFDVGATSFYNATSDFSDLALISKYVSKDGKIILIACHVGITDEDKSNILTDVSNATKRNIFGNMSWSCAGCNFFNSSQNGNCPSYGAIKGKPGNPYDRTKAFRNQGNWTMAIYNNGKPILSTIKNVQIINGNFTYTN